MIYNSTQSDGQGPDIGPQYRSEVFYTTDEQKDITEKIITTLRMKGYDVKTKVTSATTLYDAEKSHQDYYERKGTEPYCHSRKRIF